MQILTNFDFTLTLFNLIHGFETPRSQSITSIPLCANLTSSTMWTAPNTSSETSGTRLFLVDSSPLKSAALLWGTEGVCRTTHGCQFAPLKLVGVFWLRVTSEHDEHLHQAFCCQIKKPIVSVRLSQERKKNCTKPLINTNKTQISTVLGGKSNKAKDI